MAFRLKSPTEGGVIMKSPTEGGVIMKSPMEGGVIKEVQVLRVLNSTFNNTYISFSF